MSACPIDYAQQLADYLHESCEWWTPDRPATAANCRKDHKGYYRDQAETLIGQLEPMIGIANVLPVVRIVMEEVS